MFRASPPSPCNLYFKHYLGPRCRYFLCFDFFPAFFKWTFATFVFGVGSFVCITREQPFVSNCSSAGVLTVWFCLLFSEKSMNFRWTKKGNSHSWIYSRDKDEPNQEGYFLCWMNVREDGTSFSDPT